MFTNNASNEINIKEKYVKLIKCNGNDNHKMVVCMMHNESFSTNLTQSNPIQPNVTQWPTIVMVGEKKMNCRPKSFGWWRFWFKCQLVILFIVRQRRIDGALIQNGKHFTYVIQSSFHTLSCGPATFHCAPCQFAASRRTRQRPRQTLKIVK